MSIARELLIMRNTASKCNSLILGQCTDIMRQKIESHESFAGVSSVGDGLGLLKLIKGVAFHFQSQIYLPYALHKALKRGYNCAQGKFATAQAYLEHFQNVVAVVTKSGGSIAGHEGVENTSIIAKGEVLEHEDMTEAQLTEMKEEATARSTGMAFLLGCDRSRCGGSSTPSRTISIRTATIFQRPWRRRITCSQTGSRSALGGGHQLPTEWHSPTWRQENPTC
jgi:hypothetical protein